MTDESISAEKLAAPLRRPETEEQSRWTLADIIRRIVQTPPLAWAAVVIFVVLGFVLFRTTGWDDSYISYWPAHTLVKYGHVINYNGDAVEQSSSLLWVVILAAISAITGARVPFLGPLLSIAFGGLAVFTASQLAARVNDRRVQGYAVLFTATAAYLMYWSFSGMETSLAAVCTSWLALIYSDCVAGAPFRKVACVTATLACVLVRPEMGAVLCFMLVGLAGVLWVRRRLGLIEADLFWDFAKRIGLLALVVIGVCIGVGVVRTWLFHSPLPEPAMVKGGKHWHLHKGLVYLFFSWCTFYALPAASLTIVGTVATLKEAMSSGALNMTRVICVMLLLANSCFVVWVGGDWMELGRFLVPELPVALFLAAYALCRFTPSRLLHTAGLAVVVIQLCGIVWCAKRYGTATSTSNPPTVDGSTWFDRTDQQYLRDAPVADALDRVVTRMVATGHPVSHILSGQMGVVMYRLASRHFGQIDVTDRFGLADRRLSGCSLVSDRLRLPTGIEVDYLWFMTHYTELNRSCRIPLPDIIYDIEKVSSMTRPRILQKYGYALVYHKRCNAAAELNWIGGIRKPSNEFIGVRRDLLASLAYTEIPGDVYADATR